MAATTAASPATPCRRGGDVRRVMVGQTTSDALPVSVATVAFRKAVHRLTTPVEQLDREELSEFCQDCGFEPLESILPRTRVSTGGEVRSVRIVPRAGAPALEVTFSDGAGSATAVFLGRRKIAGMTPGRRIAVEGMVAAEGRRLVLYNPGYTFLG